MFKQSGNFVIVSSRIGQKINFILLIDEPSAYQTWAGDINGDIAINVIDIVQLVNLILS